MGRRGTGTKGDVTVVSGTDHRLRALLVSGRGRGRERPRPRRRRDGRWSHGGVCPISSPTHRPGPTCSCTWMPTPPSLGACCSASTGTCTTRARGPRDRGSRTLEPDDDGDGTADLRHGRSARPRDGVAAIRLSSTRQPTATTTGTCARPCATPCSTPTKSAEVAPSQKVGFCLADSEHVGRVRPDRERLQPIDRQGRTDFCELGNPTAPQVTMGISAGWRDIYSAGVSFQWVDVVRRRPGHLLAGCPGGSRERDRRCRSDQQRLVFAASASVIPGFVARPVSVNVAPSGPKPSRSTPRALARALGEPAVQDHHRPGSRDAQPARRAGVLRIAADVHAVGQLHGTDSFTFVALNADSEFPRNPAQATVTLTGSAAVPTVAISGAPASMLAGTSVQLTATVTGDPPAVEWRVNGVLGGTTATGTITSLGLIPAPAAPPAGGTVTIRATSAPRPARGHDPDRPPAGARARAVSRPLRHSRRRHLHPAPVPAPADPGPAPASVPAPGRLARAPTVDAASRATDRGAEETAASARRPRSGATGQRARDRRVEPARRHGRGERLEGLEPARPLSRADARLAVADLPDPPARRFADQRHPGHRPTARQGKGRRDATCNLHAADRRSPGPRALSGHRARMLALEASFVECGHAPRTEPGTTVTTATVR